MVAHRWCADWRSSMLTEFGCRRQETTDFDKRFSCKPTTHSQVPLNIPLLCCVSANDLIILALAQIFCDLFCLNISKKSRSPKSCGHSLYEAPQQFSSAPKPRSRTRNWIPLAFQVRYWNIGAPHLKRLEYARHLIQLVGDTYTIPHDSFLTYVSQCKGLSATSFVLHFFFGSCTQATHHTRPKCSHQGSTCLQRLREHNFQPCTLVRFGSTVTRRASKPMQTPCAKCCRKLRRLGTNCAAKPLLLHRR